MKTITEALLDEVHYPIPEGFVYNRLVARGLDGDSDFSQDVANSTAFRGAVADTLVSLVQAPNFSEASKSISLGDRNLILKLANSIYSSIGEDEVDVGDVPKVFIGG